ncbi:MAG: OB-fold domain-containing protein [Dehalococcoidia bacterium]|nr:OB-fold domain-containing protein [Dehalococcoidia bacterium]
MTDATPAPSRPLPQADEISKEFFDGGMAGRLMLMKCTACGALRLPSRRHCDVCLADETAWVESSGKGVVRSFGIMHQRYHPGFQTPYNVAFVELEEGVRLPTNIVGVANDAIRVGMPVVVEWDRYEDVALPKFRPA